MVTWEQICEDKPGTVYKDWMEGNLRCIIRKGASSLCAYIGIPKSHVLAGIDYQRLDVQVHGGLTFDSWGDGERWPKGFYWFGWDYAHSGDYCTYNDLPMLAKFKFWHEQNDHKWMVEEVYEEIVHAVPQFQELLKEASGIERYIYYTYIKTYDWVAEKYTQLKYWWAGGQSNYWKKQLKKIQDLSLKASSTIRTTTYGTKVKETTDDKGKSFVNPQGELVEPEDHGEEDQSIKSDAS